MFESTSDWGHLQQNICLREMFPERNVPVANRLDNNSEALLPPIPDIKIISYTKWESHKSFTKFSKALVKLWKVNDRILGAGVQSQV